MEYSYFQGYVLPGLFPEFLLKLLILSLIMNHSPNSLHLISCIVMAAGSLQSLPLLETSDEW